MADRPEDFEALDRYLKTVFGLLEGIEDVPQAFHHLQDYLQWHRREGLPPELEDFLLELFYHKCRKELDRG